MPEMSIDDFYRGQCESCGVYIDSAYCEKVEDGYECYGYGKTHKVAFAKKYFVRLVHLSGKIKTGRINIRTNISNFIRLIGSHGWIATEYSELTVDSDTNHYYTIQKVKLGGVDAGQKEINPLL